MGTYKLWELASTRDEVHQLAEQVAENMVANDYHLTKKGWDEEAQAFVYAIWREMWERRRYANAPAPFTHKVTGVNIPEVLRKIAPSVKSLDLARIASAAYRILANNDLLLRVSEGSSKTFFIREWPKGFQPEWDVSGGRWISRKARADLERQDRKAEEVAGEVNSHVDLSIIPLPDPDPDSILAYIRKVVPVAKRLQEENLALRARLAELESGKWSEVATELEEILGWG